MPLRRTGEFTSVETEGVGTPGFFTRTAPRPPHDRPADVREDGRGAAGAGFRPPPGSHRERCAGSRDLPKPPAAPARSRPAPRPDVRRGGLREHRRRAGRYASPGGTGDRGRWSPRPTFDSRAFGRRAGRRIRRRGLPDRRLKSTGPDAGPGEPSPASRFSSCTAARLTRSASAPAATRRPSSGRRPRGQAAGTPRPGSAVRPGPCSGTPPPARTSPSSPSGSGSSWTTLYSSAAEVSPEKGGRPVAAYAGTAPGEKTSAAPVTPSPRTCSGGMQPGEPIDTPVDVRDAVPSGARAMPKSMSSGPSRVRRTFEGFTSRCTSPRSCTAAGASAGPAPSPRTVAAGSGPVSATAAARDGPAEQPVGPHGRGLVPFERPHPSAPPP